MTQSEEEYIRNVAQALDEKKKKLERKPPRAIIPVVKEKELADIPATFYLAQSTKKGGKGAMEESAFKLVKRLNALSRDVCHPLLWKIDVNLLRQYNFEFKILETVENIEDSLNEHIQFCLTVKNAEAEGGNKIPPNECGFSYNQHWDKYGSVCQCRLKDSKMWINVLDYCSQCHNFQK